jgi:hypothetical protein
MPLRRLLPAPALRIGSTPRAGSMAESFIKTLEVEAV